MGIVIHEGGTDRRVNDFHRHKRLRISTPPVANPIGEAVRFVRKRRGVENGVAVKEKDDAA